MNRVTLNLMLPTGDIGTLTVPEHWWTDFLMEKAKDAKCFRSGAPSNGDCGTPPAAALQKEPGAA